LQQKITNPNCFAREKLLKTIFYEKVDWKLLVKSTPMINLTYNLLAVFMLLKKLQSQYLIRGTLGKAIL